MDPQITTEAARRRMFAAACESMFREPLFRHPGPDGGIDVLIWSDDHAAVREYLTVAVSCGCIEGVGLNIEVCGADMREFEQALLNQCPMFHEFFNCREDTASIRFSEEPPAQFPACVICSPENEPRLPEECFHIVMGEGAPSPELERLAENLHYTFSVSYDGRKSLSAILEELRKDDYSYLSSLLQAAHLPAKLHCAGLYEAYVNAPEDAAKRFTQLAETDQTLVNRLVYAEHLRWSAFMILSGWRKPTIEEMESYAFVEQPDPGDMIAEFRHRKRRLHPSLAACSFDGVDALEGASGARFWDGVAAEAEVEALDELSRISLWQHQYVSKLAEKHRSIVYGILNDCRAASADLLPELDSLEGALNRLVSRQSGAAAEVKRALNQAKTILGEAQHRRIAALLKSSEEAARRRSYLQGDIFSARTIGFVLLFRRSFTRIVRALCDTPESNVTALMHLDPEKAVFITGFDDDRTAVVESELRGGVEAFVRTRNLRTEVRFVDVRGEMDDAVREALAEAGANAVLDVTGAPPEFMLSAVDSDCFMVKNGRLKPIRGCHAIEAMNTLPRELLVADIFAAMNRTAFEGWNVPDMEGIEKLIVPAFKVYLEQTANETSEGPGLFSGEKGLVQKLNGVFPFETYQKSFKDEVPAPVEPFELPAEVAVNRNVTGCLKRLEEDGFISDLQVEPLKNGDGKTEKYRYSLTSCDWVQCNNSKLRLLDMLRSTADTDYTCSARYNKDHKPQIKAVHSEFSAPGGFDAALEAFGKAGCFEKLPQAGKWRFASAAAKGIFAKEGNILEDYLWVQIRKNPHFKDVQLSYSFGLVNQDWTEQEIDVVAITQNNRPVMFSCKLGGKALNVAAAKEIYNHCRLYSMNHPVPVLVSSCPESILREKGFSEGGRGLEYVRSLGVHFIDRSILSDENLLQRTLNDIAQSKRAKK